MGARPGGNIDVAFTIDGVPLGLRRRRRPTLRLRL